MTEKILTLLKPVLDSFETKISADSSVPLLAHYTSIQKLESILKSSSLWFSNPLFMNDLNELRFGVHKGVEIFNSLKLQELLSITESQSKVLSKAFEDVYKKDNDEGAIDTYVFSMMDHSPDNKDGKLSMWRAYGDNGNGVALIFDISSLSTELSAMPFALIKVQYATEIVQKENLTKLLQAWGHAIKGQNLADEDLLSAGELAFKIIKLFAISTKHMGFEEEQEWRFVYMKEFDESQKLVSSISYSVGPRGVEPRLKFKVCDFIAADGNTMNFEKLLHSIIVGPSHHKNLTLYATQKMLNVLNINLVKIDQSKIPFRPA